jgi:hypothetical protein
MLLASVPHVNSALMREIKKNEEFSRRNVRNRGRNLHDTELELKALFTQ